MSSSSEPHQNHRDSSTPNQLGNNTTGTSSNKIIISILALVIAVLIAALIDPANLYTLRRFSSRVARSATTTATSPALASTRPESTASSISKPAIGLSESSTMKTPVYFLSHGGPDVMYQTDHPAYKKLGSIGREITTKVKPDAVVVFSAHWQGGEDVVYVNTAEMTDLIYDFYGFPDHFYKEKYPHVGSRKVADQVLAALNGAGIEAKGVKRGLDHGVWASFKCAFEPETNPLNVPIVQVSLFKTEDPDQHYRLGQAVAHLREKNILIIVSGMAVHNLRDLRFTMGSSRPLPYAISFDEALKDAVVTDPAERQSAMAKLLDRPDARQAHPWFDHLLPIHVGAGAAGSDRGKRLWTFPEGSMSWAQYRFGEVENSNSSL